MMLQANYPYHFKNGGENSQMAMQMIWEYQFKDEPYQSVIKAVQEWISKKQYVPTVADIKTLIAKKDTEKEDYWHKRFGYGDETIYFDDDFLNSVIWEDVPKDIQERMQYHCNPKDYESYNSMARKVIEVTGNTSVKFYTSMDTEFLKGKMVTWTNEVITV